MTAASATTDYRARNAFYTRDRGLLYGIK